MSRSSLRLILLPLVCLVAVACASDGGPRQLETGVPPTTSESASTDSETSDPAETSSSSLSSSTRSADSSSSGSDPSTTGLTSTGSADTGPRPSICDDVAGQALIPPTQCDGPGGNTATEVPPNALYATSWFGCYMEEDGSIVEDPFDNCEFACGSQGLCPAGQAGPICEATLRWFAADVDRYGCGGRIRVTNCENGASVVLATLDRGPNCNSVEMACDAPVLDMSHDAMVYLFDGGTFGGCDHEVVVVEPVDADTPLGPG